MITLFKYTGVLSHTLLNRNAIGTGKKLFGISAKEMKYCPGLLADTYSIRRTKDLLNLPERLIKQKICEAAATPVIGKGKTGKVYRVPDTNYVVKINNNVNLSEVKDKKLSFDITPQEKGNHIVAKLDDNISIMKYIEGEELTGQFSVKDFKVPELKNYIQQLHLQAQNGMRLDKGGKNTRFNPKNGSLTPLDFYPNPPAKKYEFLNDTFIQTYNCAKSPEEAEELLAKIVSGYLDLLKDGSITKSFSRRMSVNLGAIKDVFKTDKVLNKSNNFAGKLELKLEKIIGLKRIEGLSMRTNQELDAAIMDLRTSLNTKY